MQRGSADNTRMRRNKRIKKVAGYSGHAVMYNKDKLMRKLLGKAAVESSPSSSVVDNSNHSVTSAPHVPGTIFRPSASQDASFDAGVPIGSLDRSPDGQSAILAGRHILKTVKLDGTRVQDGIDLRAAILAQPVVKNSTTSVADQLSIKDVKWLRGRGDTTIFTACANGKIFQYDLTRLGGGVDGAPMDVIHMREDSRQINTLDINPRSSYLLAGSQDGIVRCFDIMNPVRTHTGHLTFRAVQAFKCNAGGVQCIQWSPHVDGAWSFACGTEQGVVLKWDIRKASAPVLRINAHDKACATIAWHPDGDHLVSGGWDNKCHVWDVSGKADKRQKPKWVINTPAPVSDVAWRPGIWSATAQGKRTAQLAVTYDDSSHARHGINACHIWDLARPTMAFKEVSKFDAPPAALLWHDQDLLWTAGHDGLFNQFDIAYAPKVVDRSTISTPAAPMLSISQSDSDDEVTGSFLGARRARHKHRRTVTGSRSSHLLSTTPPGGPDAPIMALEESIKATGLFRSQQAMAIGRVPSAAKVSVYEYLSTQYLEVLSGLLPYKRGSLPLDLRVKDILEHYAKAAETVGLFRLAQTWRALEFAVGLLLGRRAQFHLDWRTGELERSEKAKAKARSISHAKSPAPVHPLDAMMSKLGQAPSAQSNSMQLDPSSGGVKHSLNSDKSNHHRSLLAEELESTSQTTTPLVRPMDDGEEPVEQHCEPADHRFEYGKKLTPVQEGGSFSLPPPLQVRPSRRRLDSEPISHLSQDSDTYASTEGYDFYDTDAISKAIDVPGANGEAGLDFVAGTPSSVRRIAARQEDSDESFGHMFSISSGSRQAAALTQATPSSGSVLRRPYKAISALQQHPQLARSISTGEFESRIRGAKIKTQEPPKLSHNVSSVSARTDDAMVTQSTDEDYQLATQTTMDSIDPRKGESHPMPDFFPVETPQPASAGISPFQSFAFSHDPEQPQETDYLPWSDDPRYPHPIAWEDQDVTGLKSLLDPYKLFARALNFETKKSALHASIMVLLLQPLIRDDDIIDTFQAAAILKQHHSRLMGMKLFTEAALLRKMCVKGWPGPPLQEWGENYPALYRPAQLNNTVAFLCPECRKPREIIRRDMDRRTGNPIWRCERCSAVMGPCAICQHRDAPEAAAESIELSMDLLHSAIGSQEDGKVMSGWWYCPGCGHGGHASCIAGWHSEIIEDETDSSLDESGDSLYSDGCCPMDGCGHACLPGKYRAETAVARTEEVSRAVREVTRNTTQPTGMAKRVFGPGRYSTGALDELMQRAARGRGDDSGPESGVHDLGNEIPQSRAVEHVRGSLASGQASPKGGLGTERASGPANGLSTSPGKDGMGSDRERRKSVKFAGSATVVPDETNVSRRR
ncbi:SEA (Seh1-associated) complex subunit [Cytospora paraplurivora]|uniref:SEA (Seh1-associated) complex subunit n=1 Tax=Cytospora paraplurivora TaxID=2898453 RepID=A0AAN9U6X6_9PEZI